ncbi:MAG: hypothetical protein JNK23_04720 [Opitutaceae bacterium]|nr:hypothetical protein [Opitutaceae bacterium]
MASGKPVCVGMQVHLVHVKTRTVLTALQETYRHDRSSKQPMVVTTQTGVSHSGLDWLVKGPHGESDLGAPGRVAKRGAIVRLEHVSTRKNLHSHDHPSPILGDQQEVSAFGAFGNGDESDNWVVDPVRGDEWLFGDEVRLIHQRTGKALHSHAGSDPKLTAGFQEVTCFGSRDDNDLWIAYLHSQGPLESGSAAPRNQDARSIALQQLNDLLARTRFGIAADEIPAEFFSLCDTCGLPPAELGRIWQAIIADWIANSAFPWSPPVTAFLQYTARTHATMLDRVGLKSFAPQITPRVLFLTLLRFGVDDAGRGNSEGGDELLRLFGPASGLTLEQVENLLRAQYQRPDGDPRGCEAIPVDLPSLAHQANNAREEIGGSRSISARHLLLALFELVDGTRADPLWPTDGVDWDAMIHAFSATAAARKDDDPDDPDEWHPRLGMLIGRIKPASAGPRKKVEIGSKDDWERETESAEAALRVDDYAEVLATIYTQAGPGEFSLAIFGHWGRGKTFLMRRLKRRLAQDKYETVHFSAWKYPTTPEVWVHLYETLAERVCAGSSFVRIPRLIRTGIARHGSWPIIAALAAMALSLTPKIWLASVVAESVVDLIRVAGLGGAVWLVIFVLGVRRTRDRLVRDYMTATRHIEKLGLQGTIGRDLRALLDGWMPLKLGVSRWGIGIYFAVAAWICYTAHLWFEHSWFQAAGVPDLRLPIGIAISVFLPVWVFFPWKKPARVLLVIDDLDRCTTAQLLHVVESLKLLTEDDVVSRRIQVAALVDEDIFEHAVLKKHGDLKKAHCAKRFDQARVIRENREKLFTAHLRLPPLEPTELKEVLDFVIGGKERGQPDRPDAGGAPPPADSVTPVEGNDSPPAGRRISPPGGPPDGLGETDGARLTEIGNVAAVAPASAEPQAPITIPSPIGDATESGLLRVKFRFSEDERTALVATVSAFSQMPQTGLWGPRSVRALVFRYQLARLLANRLLAEKWTPAAICEEMVRQARSEGETKALVGTLAKIVRQVN